MMLKLKNTPIICFGQNLVIGFMTLTFCLLLVAFGAWAILVAPFRFFFMSPGEIELSLIYTTFGIDYLVVSYFVGCAVRDEHQSDPENQDDTEPRDEGTAHD